MRKHLHDVSKTWSNYTAGIFGLVNKMFVQMLVSGAMSMEAVPKKTYLGLKALSSLNQRTLYSKEIKMVNIDPTN